MADAGAATDDEDMSAVGGIEDVLDLDDFDEDDVHGQVCASCSPCMCVCLHVSIFVAQTHRHARQHTVHS